MDLTGQIALVTGAANGIGLQITRQLLKAGVQGVAMLDVNAALGNEKLTELTNEFGSGRIIFIETNVQKLMELEDAFDKTVATFGSLDIVVNNAGICNETDYELEIDTNFTGVVRGNILGLKYMGKDKQGRGGVILNTASLTSFVHQQYFPIYAATKAGIVNMTRGLGHSAHYTITGVKVMTLCPGYTDTAIITEEFRRDTVGILIPQSSEAVGRAAIHAIKHGDSTAVWIIDANQLYRVNMPDWKSVSEHIVTYDIQE